MTSKGSVWGHLETDSATPDEAHVGKKSAVPRKKENVTVRKQQDITIGYDEYELLQATIQRQEGKIVQLRQVYEVEINDKERELQIVKEKSKKLEKALVGTERQLANMVKLQMIQIGTSIGEHSSLSGQEPQANCVVYETLLPQSSPVMLVKENSLSTKPDNNIQQTASHLSNSEQTNGPFYLGSTSASFDKVMQENRRLRKHCQELKSSNGRTTISLDNQEYEEIITKLKQELMNVKLQMQDAQISLTLKENGQKDALAEKLVELQREKVKLSKSVVAKASLLSIYNKEYERLKQENIQLRQQVSEKHNAEADMRQSTEQQPGSGRVTLHESDETEVEQLKAKYANQIEELNAEMEMLRNEVLRQQYLNKTYAKCIEELTRTRMTVDEQPVCMADMRKELERLRSDKDLYADDIGRYTRKMDEMELELKEKDIERLKQIKFKDAQMKQLQEQYQKLTKENTELQRQLDEVTLHNRQLKYQLSRSPQTSTESPSVSPALKGQSFGEGVIVADGIGDDEEEFVCARCERKFSDREKFAVHVKKCNDS